MPTGRRRRWRCRVFPSCSAFCHHGFDVGHGLGVAWVMMSQPSAVTRASSSMRMPMFQKASGHAVGRADVGARFDGQDVARNKVAPLAADLVFARVMHVEAEPVAGAMHVELTVAGFEGGVEAAGEEAEVDEALGEHAGRASWAGVPAAPGRISAMAAAWAARTSS